MIATNKITDSDSQVSELDISHSHLASPSQRHEADDGANQTESRSAALFAYQDATDAPVL